MSTGTTASARKVRTVLILRTGAAASVLAAAATTAFSGASKAVGVTFELPPGKEAIPASGFAVMTLICAAIGVVLAIALAHKANNPPRTFLITTVVLTILSLAGPFAVTAEATTRIALLVSHLVAAAVFIPMVTRRLAHQ
jgi:hypothetical protein